VENGKEIIHFLACLQFNNPKPLKGDFCFYRILSHWRFDPMAEAQDVAKLAYEAIELAKSFGGPSSGKFVNGVLGSIYKDTYEKKS